MECAEWRALLLLLLLLLMLLNVKTFFCALFFILPDYYNGFCSATSICQILFCSLNKGTILNKIGKPVYVFRFYTPKQEFNLTYLLTSWSRVLLEKLTGSQLVKKFPAFYGTRRFITASTSARHLSLS